MSLSRITTTRRTGPQHPVLLLSLPNLFSNECVVTVLVQMELKVSVVVRRDDIVGVLIEETDKCNRSRVLTEGDPMERGLECNFSHIFCNFARQKREEAMVNINWWCLSVIKDKREQQQHREEILYVRNGLLCLPSSYHLQTTLPLRDLVVSVVDPFLCSSVVALLSLELRY